MKLKDILKINTNKISWLKVFKKLGADNETMKFVNDNVGKESSDDGGGNNNIELTKGKKILSEYYYFDLGLIQNNNNNIYSSIFNTFMTVFGFSLSESEEKDEKMNIVEVGVTSSSYDKTEVGNVILKYKIANGNYGYMYDSLPLGSGVDGTKIYIAIRKYCPIYIIDGSGMYIPDINLANFADFFDIYMYNAMLQSEVTEESMNQAKQLFNNMINDCSITEEEFWAEAEIINDINEILP